MCLVRYQYQWSKLVQVVTISNSHLLRRESSVVLKERQITKQGDISVECQYFGLRKHVLRRKNQII